MTEHQADPDEKQRCRSRRNEDDQKPEDTQEVSAVMIPSKKTQRAPKEKDRQRRYDLALAAIQTAGAVAALATVLIKSLGGG